MASFLDLERPNNPEALTRAAERYIGRAVEGELARAARGEGGRNNALNQAAFALGTMVGSGWVAEAAAEAQLMAAATTSGYVETDGAKAAARTIRSGLTRGKLSPRDLPSNLVGADLRGLGLAPLSEEAVAEARALARARETEAQAHRDRAEEHLRKASYLSMCANELHNHAEALAALRVRMIGENTVEAFGLGYDRFPLPDAPADYGPVGRRPSLVLPWRGLDPARVDAVQYRHLDTAGAKVHWHHVLHPGKLWNGAAILDPQDSDLFVVEGALAACTLHSAGVTSVVALPQMQVDRTELAGWAAQMAVYDRVFWLPDHGAAGVWREYAALVPGQRGRCVPLPADPDEFLVALDGNVDRFWRAIRTAT